MAIRFQRGALVVVAIGCHGSEPPAHQQAARPEPTPPQEPTPVPTQPDFPDGTRSLTLVRTVGVRLEPGDDAKRIGTVAIDTRVGWTRTAAGKGCSKNWVEISPRGWICGDYVTASKLMPYGQEVPQLDRGEIVPGTYGKVTGPSSVTYLLEKPKGKPKKPKHDKHPVTSPKDVDDDPKLPHMVENQPLVGSMNVREYDELTVGGKLYWKISHREKDNDYVLASAITKHVPSKWRGARLGDDTGWGVPFAWVTPRGGGITAWTMVKPNGGGVVRQLAVRTPVPVLETASDAQQHPIAYRVSDKEWIAAGDVRVFEPAPPPETLTPGERWIDVDLDNQILVAFEGDTPVYSTLVSSGGKDTPTETGIYRIWMKESEADMQGLNGEDPYSVATVPWTEFFSPEKGLALHTAYWHDQFGKARSHGCINLAPRDARWLYFWSDPQVPPGWTMTAGVVELPGSIVRVRSKADPNPETKGYAKKVYEARLAPK